MQEEAQERTAEAVQEPAPADIRINILECVLAFAGSLVAGTLWIAHLKHISLACSEDGGCDIIAASRYAHITIGPLHDIPVALLGLLTYLALLVQSVLKIVAESHKSFRTLLMSQLGLSAFGCGYSWYLQWVAHYKVGAFCIWCRTSACIMTVLFLTIMWEFMRSRRKDTAPELAPEVSAAGAGQ
jgi:uncharacterized membrane protein